MAAVAVDLGGTFLRCAVVSDSGSVVDMVAHRIDRDLEHRDPEIIWHQVFDAIEDFAGATHAGLSPDDPIAFAFPGPIENHERILRAPTLVGHTADMPDVVHILRGRTRRGVYLLNDVSAAAWHFLDVVDAERFMVVTVSSGIGSKLADRAHPDRVLDGWAYAGEIGHVVVDATVGAPVCDCGGSGHLGAIASGRGTENLARRMSRLDAASFDRSLCATEFGATPDCLTNERHLVPAALADDGWAWGVIRKAQEPLAQVLATAIVAASLQKVLVIGGFATGLGDGYIDCLRDAVAARTTGGLVDLRVEDVLSFGKSAAEACLRGAGLFAASVVRASP